MLQHNKPDDYVLATGENHTVRELIEEACKNLDIDLAWKGRGVNEVGIDAASGKSIIFIDPAYFRPAEVDILIGDASKAKRVLGWKPKTKFMELVKLMVDAEVEELVPRIRSHESSELIGYYKK